MSTEQTLEQISFQIILYAGNTRSSSMEAIRCAREGKFQEATEKLSEANQAFQQAHQVQTALLHQEANGASQSPSILLVHAQDHLMTALTVKELAEELVHVYQRIS